jgi:membrane-bound transcription factor site-1 protease
LAIEIEVAEEARSFDGIVEGQVTLEVESNSAQSGKVMRSELKLFLRAKIIPTPPRKQRILWDQWHNLRYPSGYFPRDNLKIKNDPLDWNADHV